MSIRQGNKIIAGNVDNTDYTTLLNKPQINSIELNGNKTLEELGIQASGDYATTSELELKADKADTLAGYGITDGLNTSQITNCITKIPQDIKLEINDGALTIKAGSKVYNGDGTSVNIDSDLTATTNNHTGICFIRLQENLLFADWDISTFSSGTDSTGFSGWYFNTNDKTLANYVNGVKTPNTDCALPLGIVTVSNGAITSIDQVFNGFGYIGNTIFALPGVEGLIPNGRNADGSLNNIKWKSESVLTLTPDTLFAGTFYFGAYDNQQSIAVYEDKVTYYDENKNIVIDTYPEPDVERYGWSLWGTLTRDATNRITFFNYNHAFQSVDRNDTEWASIQGKPSNKYNDLILEASGSNFTVPSNGWLFCNATVSSDNLNNNFLSLTNNSTFMAIQSMSTNTQSTLGHNLYIPCKKNDIITITYSGTLSGSFTRFIYDEGAK